MKEEKNGILAHFMRVMIKGLLWILPMVAVVMIIVWLYEKIDRLVENVFELVGFSPQNNEFLWLIAVVIIFLVLLYIVGHFIDTGLASLFEKLFCKIPGYSTLKDIIGIFNASKDGQKKVLVVAIKGFAKEGYNIGLMYSQKESIIKDHYTVTLSMTPIPNGGYMFEVHKDKIFVIEEATFDDNLQYLLSMGVKSMADVLKTKPRALSDFTPLASWLER
ncbi:MAG: DUF502 domain-containing protein [Epsilonproteobacteria bacterium]|nr:DUF502 domain-containing protein [Campylobacterota bacterium]